MAPRPVDLILHSLSVRIAGVLGLALLPIGLIALFQTTEASRQFARQVELSYLSWTVDASLEERRAIERAIGSASALGAVVQPLLDQPENCTGHLREFVEDNSEFNFVGFIGQDGLMSCSSTGKHVDFSDDPLRERFTKGDPPLVTAHQEGPVTGEAVITVSQPIFNDDEWIGHITISIPSVRLHLPARSTGVVAPIEVVTLNDVGEVLTTSGSDPGAVTAILPNGHDLRVLQAEAPKAFLATSVGGDTYYYAAVPIVRNAVYGLSIWPRAPHAMTGGTVPTFLFPLIMWVASLVVAFFAVDRLVLRPIRFLNLEMGRFAKNRALPSEGSADEILGTSREFAALQNSFHDMAIAVLRDEAELENSVQEKTVLLKEIHHRVKNNLQMISSIMNMQIRKTRSPETSAILRRLQERVLGLAAIHKNLHENEDVGQIDVAQMVEQLANQIVATSTVAESEPKMTFDLDPLVMYPDQAVPLCLFTSEALANALKFMDAPRNAEKSLEIRLKTSETGKSRLEITNTTSDEQREDVNSTGLGEQLMRAFATQLGGRIETVQDDLHHSVFVEFEAKEFSPEVRDY